MKRWGKYSWRDSDIEEPTETGAYLVTYLDEAGNERKRIIWFFVHEGTLGSALNGLKPEKVEGPLPGSRVEEWPKHFVCDECCYNLVGAVVTRARKDAEYTGTGATGVKNRVTARKFLESFPLGKKALAEIDAKAMIREQRKERKKRCKNG